MSNYAYFEMEKTVGKLVCPNCGFDPDKAEDDEYDEIKVFSFTGGIWFDLKSDGIRLTLEEFEHAVASGWEDNGTIMCPICLHEGPLKDFRPLPPEDSKVVALDIRQAARLLGEGWEYYFSAGNGHDWETVAGELRKKGYTVTVHGRSTIAIHFADVYAATMFKVSDGKADL